MERFKKQVDFLIEIDKVKNILRMTSIVDGSRRENDAKYSWKSSYDGGIICRACQ